MRGATEKDVEKLLKGADFSNPDHKEALRERLFGNAMDLSVDDLTSVVGGVGTDDSDFKRIGSALQLWMSKEQSDA